MFRFKTSEPAGTQDYTNAKQDGTKDQEQIQKLVSHFFLNIQL